MVAAIYVVVFNFKLSMEIPYSNSSSVKCSSSSCLYNLTLCLYICEYVRTFVLGTLKIKLRSGTQTPETHLCDEGNSLRLRMLVAN